MKLPTAEETASTSFQCDNSPSEFVPIDHSSVKQQSTEDTVDVQQSREEIIPEDRFGDNVVEKQTLFEVLALEESHVPAISASQTNPEARGEYWVASRCKSHPVKSDVALFAQ